MRGLFQKYTVERKDGKEIDWCFVLELGDSHARKAMRAYAESCVKDNPALAHELMRTLCDYFDPDIPRAEPPTKQQQGSSNE